ncbi:hypothetical protein HMPREF1870_00951 [Bacteroidales bacterium KA00344]|nr:hypothetical protein HMPREF1870_00951 [Bacteroidales bacterium KA00344]
MLIKYYASLWRALSVEAIKLQAKGKTTPPVAKKGGSQTKKRLPYGKRFFLLTFLQLK